VPALELDDGRVLSETRAICTYLEGLHPEPNLMGADFEERAFIEMADRRMEMHLLLEIAHSARHTHPGAGGAGAAAVPDFGASQANKMRITARWLDQVLARQPYVAGERFTDRRHHRLLRSSSGRASEIPPGGGDGEPAGLARPDRGGRRSLGQP
jgi:glutathione S-transferase